jgi:phenylacetate-CoA ligase
VQDIVSLSDRPCPCGRPGRILTNIDGRKEDYIVLASGARLGRLDHVFKDMVHIREAQLYQERPGELTVRIVPGERYSAAEEERLRRELIMRVGVDTLLSIEYVGRLERSSTGKLRFVVSHVPRGQLTAPSPAGFPGDGTPPEKPVPSGER